MNGAHWLTLMPATAAVFALLLAAVVGPRRIPGARPFAGLMLSAALWSLGYTFELSSDQLSRALFWYRVKYLAVPLLSPFWLILVMEITAKSSSARRWDWALLLPAPLFTALVWTDGGREWFLVAPELSSVGPFPRLVFGRGPAYWAHFGFAWLLFAVGALALLRDAARGRALVRRHAFYLLGAALAPSGLNLAPLFGYRPWGAFDPTPFGFVAAGLLLLWGVFRAALFSLVPTARAHVFERIPEGILVSDENGYLMDCNAAARRLLGKLNLGYPLQESPGIWPSLGMAMRQAALSGGEAAAQTLTSTDHEATISVIGGPRRVRGVVAVVHNVRERRQAESELRRRERLLSALSEVARLLLPARGMPDLEAILRRIGEAARADVAFIGLNEFRADGVQCMVLQAEWRSEALAPAPAPETPPRLAYDEVGIAEWRRRLADGDTIYGRRTDFAPSERDFLQTRDTRAIMLIPLFADEGFAGVVGCERRLNDELWSPVEQEFLRNASLYLSLALRRQRVEENLRQSQKLDTVGRLAGGIAHDFNNLLQAINGYTEMAFVGIPDEDPRAADLREVLKAGQRAASLTQQLLSFSRRHNIQPQPNDMHVVLGEMRKLLLRLIGERIALAFQFDARESVVNIAAPHLEQIVMNLVVNARDAMPDGGTIRIGTRNIEVDDAQSRARGVPPGRYLSLTVEDTGAGMSPEVMAHIFEPFFTTKPRGVGTGMGLATVYGLVHQYHGHISVQSAVGRGTQFTLLFPLGAGAKAEAEAPAVADEIVRHGTLLVVEDEDAVRRLWVQVLTAAGHTVVEANSGEAALDAAHAHGGPIDVLVSDVVMPGLSGRQIAEILTAEQPEMKVLLISGYPEDAVVEGEDDVMPWPLLSKPVSTEALLHHVRELLRPPPKA